MLVGGKMPAGCIMHGKRIVWCNMHLSYYKSTDLIECPGAVNKCKAHFKAHRRQLNDSKFGKIHARRALGWEP